MNERKPVKSKRLKIIRYVNSLYATFDGSRMWEIDKSVFEILKMCDGTKTVDEIAEEIAKRIEMDKESVKTTLKSILKELEKAKFIEYVSS